MTPNSIGTPIGYPIGSDRVGANRGRIGLPIAPIVSARIDPSLVTAVSGLSIINQFQIVKAVDASAATVGFGGIE